jgi:hypothetical protein
MSTGKIILVVIGALLVVGNIAGLTSSIFDLGWDTFTFSFIINDEPSRLGGLIGHAVLMLLGGLILLSVYRKRK